MGAYILKRLGLMIPTLFGIILVNFLLLQLLPGGPVEQILSELRDGGGGALDRIGGGASEIAGQGASGADSLYRGSQGIDPAFIAALEAQFGLDRPAYERFFIMVGNYFTFDFGESFFKKQPVIDLILDKLPVSLSLGFWTLLLSYSISIPLGIRKAVKDGAPFDQWTSAVVIVGYAIPQFLFAIMLIIFFAGGSYWNIFPLRGLGSDNWAELSTLEQIGDYFWHLALPITAMAISGFATLTLLTKNSFLDEIRKQYVVTALSKGVTERRMLYGHVFRNAMLIVIASFPAAFIAMVTTSALIIEVVFSLDGLGLLGFEALQARDYPVMLGTLFLFSLLALVAQLLTDITYTLVDPRIDFESRAV